MISEELNNDDRYSPNHITVTERIMSILFSSILLIYGLIGFLIDDLYLPGKSKGGIHLHGVPMWIMLSAFAFAIANLLSVVIDYYDQRNNETNYQRFAKVTKIIGWILFGVALFVDLVFFMPSH